MIVRDAGPADHHGIRAVLISAFEDSAEADLVEQLRASGNAAIELVAEEDGEVLGQILFSPMKAPLRALALAPLAVRPDGQRKGIGSTLVEAGSHQALADGWEAIFVLGDPAYYGRFGYSIEAAAPFNCVYSGPHFMLLPLHRPLPVNGGDLRYALAFAALG